MMGNWTTDEDKDKASFMGAHRFDSYDTERFYYFKSKVGNKLITGD